MYLSSIISLIRDLIYRIVSIFRFDHMISENQQLLKNLKKKKNIREQVIKYIHLETIQRVLIASWHIVQQSSPKEESKTATENFIHVQKNLKGQTDIRALRQSVILLMITFFMLTNCHLDNVMIFRGEIQY